MLRKPPHVLVTTPESLFILLTAEKSRALFTHVEAIVVDEIHALARDKRGSHLALSLERLDDALTVSLRITGSSSARGSPSGTGASLEDDHIERRCRAPLHLAPRWKRVGMLREA